MHEGARLEHSTRRVLNEPNSRIEVLYDIQSLLDKTVRIFQIPWRLSIGSRDGVHSALRAGPTYLEDARGVSCVVTLQYVCADGGFELGVVI